MRVDLARTAAVSGAAREHDSVRNVESALTGAAIVLSTSRLWCYSVANPSGCKVTLEVRVKRPASLRGTLLGSQTYEFAADERKAVTLELSRAGVRFLRRHSPLLVRVRIIEDQAEEPGGYLTLLRAP